MLDISHSELQIVHSHFLYAFSLDVWKQLTMCTAECSVSKHLDVLFVFICFNLNIVYVVDSSAQNECTV